MSLIEFQENVLWGRKNHCEYGWYHTVGWDAVEKTESNRIAKQSALTHLWALHFCLFLPCFPVLKDCALGLGANGNPFSSMTNCALGLGAKGNFYS